MARRLAAVAGQLEATQLAKRRGGAVPESAAGTETAEEVMTRAKWQTMQTVDVRANGDASLVMDGNLVMDSEEKDNMRDLAAIATQSHDNPRQRGGRLLEVGYGLGLSAREIQR